MDDLSLFETFAPPLNTLLLLIGLAVLLRVEHRLNQLLADHHALGLHGVSDASACVTGGHRCVLHQPQPPAVTASHAPRP